MTLLYRSDIIVMYLSFKPSHMSTYIKTKAKVQNSKLGIEALDGYIVQTKYGKLFLAKRFGREWTAYDFKTGLYIPKASASNRADTVTNALEVLDSKLHGGTHNERVAYLAEIQVVIINN